MELRQGDAVAVCELIWGKTILYALSGQVKLSGCQSFVTVGTEIGEPFAHCEGWARKH